MKISAIIQARTNSKRFFGKILKKINKKPLIQIQVERLRKSQNIKTIILATTEKKSDDNLVKFCKDDLNIEVYRGSENDVLNRVFCAAKKKRVDLVVECYGDSPFIDTDVVDLCVTKFLDNKKVDVLTNSLKRTFPAGQEIAVYRKKTLSKLENIVKKNDNLREHVSFNFLRFPNKFKIYNLKAPKKFFMPNCYLEVDTNKDLIFLKKIYNEMNSLNIDLTLINIIKFLKKNKHWLKINYKVNRKWKEVFNKVIKF